MSVNLNEFNTFTKILQRNAIFFSRKKKLNLSISFLLFFWIHVAIAPFIYASFRFLNIYKNVSLMFSHKYFAFNLWCACYTRWCDYFGCCKAIGRNLISKQSNVLDKVFPKKTVKRILSVDNVWKWKHLCVYNDFVIINSDPDHRLNNMLKNRCESSAIDTSWD